jgi:TrmH family RNA methyltransferase
MVTTKISSVKNDLIKDIVNLQSKSKERKGRNITLIEGLKEISVAVAAGVTFDKVFFCPEITPESDVIELIGQNSSVRLYELSPEVFAKISYRETTGGIVVVANTENKKLDNLVVHEDSLFIILESVEKPGNLGAICRIADAAKVDAVIVCDPLTDIYNPNTVRSSLGCVFSVNVVGANSDEVLSWLKNKDFTSYAAELTAAEYYHKCDLKGKTALVFGTEATGLTNKWIFGANHRIKIPMSGVIDSLNVSASVAIMVFEAKRQRDFLV